MNRPNRLSTLRIEKSLAQKELGALLNVSQTAISRYERGHNIPVDVLIKFSRFYNVPIDYILGISIIRYY